MRRLLSAASIAAATLLAVGPVAADPPGRDGAVNFRFGGFVPTGHSDFWKAKEDAFTLDQSDFIGGIGGVGYTASINNYFEFDVNADFYAASSRSADRDFTEGLNSPILHDSRLSSLPITVGFRVLPAGRYARRGTDGKHYVRRPVPYLGVGVGMSYWRYEEEGDFAFADSSSPTGFSISYDRLKDTGLAFETHAEVGIEFPIASSWNITVEVRRSWAEATLNDAFPSTALVVGDPRRLDLGGASLFLGGSLRF